MMNRKNRRKKQMISFALCLAMSQTYVPATVFAGETSGGTKTEYADVTSKEGLYQAPMKEAAVFETGIQDHDELFAAYAEQCIFGTRGISMYGLDLGADFLSTEERQVYSALKSEILNVAQNGGSTQFVLDVTNKGVTYTITQLSGNTAKGTFNIDVDKIQKALLEDCPYELYWYDKTLGMSYGTNDLFGGGVGSVTELKTLTFHFRVASDYRYNSEQYRVSDEKITITNTAKANADQVIKNAKEKGSDYEKLKYILDYIKEKVEYGNPNSTEKNTWQMIWVFDENAGTNVVCEGYAKAFKYLCDGIGVECYTVSGKMDGGGHMWNIVVLNGNSYLVDPTNCDDGTIGSPYKLFLKAPSSGSGTQNDPYVFSNAGNVKFYYEDTIFGNSNILKLAANDYQTPATYTVTVSNGQNGTVTTAKSTYAAGESVSLTITPYEGYELGTLTVKQGNQTINVTNHTFTMPQGDVTIMADFILKNVAAPTGKIQIGYKKWSDFSKWDGYQWFYNDKAEVIITADGSGSDIEKVEYLFTQQSLSQENLSSQNWTALTGQNGKYSFTIPAQNKGAVYVRITNKSGNATIINSPGIVVYKSSEISTGNLEYVYKENKDLSVQVAMNGNTLKIFKCMGGKISDSDYTIEDGKITLKAAYLDTLDKGEYKYYIGLNPCGEVDGETFLSFNVNVKAKELTVSKAVARSKEYDGKNEVEIAIVNLAGVRTGDDVSVDVNNLKGTLSSANAGSYTAVTLPNLTLIGEDAKNYTLKQPQGSVETNVIINKLYATITATKSSYEKVYGDSDFSLEITENNLEANVTYISSNKSVVKISNGKAIIMGTGEAEITVSLAGSTNYYPAQEVRIYIKIEKADSPKNKPSSTMTVSNAYTKVSDVTTLPDGWVWADADKNKELKNGEAVSATAVYAGADKYNYKNVTVTVAVSRSKCEHKEGSVVCDNTVVATDKAPTCTETGIGHTICTKEGCGEVVRNGITIKELGHDYKSEITKPATTKETGIKTYTCSREGCKDSYEETIPKKSDTKDPSTEEPGTEDPGESTINWKSDKNGVYYEKEDGTRAKGWMELKDGQWYYFDKSGYRKTDWVKDGINWYYLNKDGVMQTGWVKDGANWYYLSESGAMKTGWQKDGANWYYLSESGAMKTGWVKDRANWYYLSESGAMKTGWLKNGTNWYYLNTNGSMKTGWLQIGKDWFYLNTNGAMATDTYIGTWYVDKNGYYIPTKTR